MSLKTTSGEFLGMYELDFSCSLIFHQLWTHIGYFKGKKDQLIFSPISAIFYRQADFQTLQQPPKSDSWGFHGGIPSSGTQGSPPNHNWQKNIFMPQNPKSHSQPSVHWENDYGNCSHLSIEKCTDRINTSTVIQFLELIAWISWQINDPVIEKANFYSIMKLVRTID